MHGYYEKKLEQDPGIDRCLSFVWKKDRYVTSECENYLSAIQDQELTTKYLRYKRVRDKDNIPNHNNKCRLCMSSVEDIDRSRFSWLPSNVIKILSSLET